MYPLSTLDSLIIFSSLFSYSYSFMHDCHHWTLTLTLDIMEILNRINFSEFPFACMSDKTRGHNAMRENGEHSPNSQEAVKPLFFLLKVKCDKDNDWFWGGEERDGLEEYDYEENYGLYTTVHTQQKKEKVKAGRKGIINKFVRKRRRLRNNKLKKGFMFVCVLEYIHEVAADVLNFLNCLLPFTHLIMLLCFFIHFTFIINDFLTNP